jgi:ureidoglycolate lyase
VRGAGRDPALGIYVAKARRFPLRIERLERHRQASQTFLALGAHRFVVVVAPGVDAPDWEGLRAFVTAPGQGVSLARGCWHHGLVALGDGDRFAVIEGGDYRRDTYEAAAPAAIELDAPD